MNVKSVLGSSGVGWIRSELQLILKTEIPEIMALSSNSGVGRAKSLLLKSHSKSEITSEG